MGELAELAGQILSLTRDLLRNAGLGYVVMPAAPKAQAGAAGGLGRDSALDAFADAGMVWAEIVGHCIALAEVLLGQGRLGEVRALIAALAASGEPRTAVELERRLTAATRDRYKKSLRTIRGSMAKKEIDDALTSLSEALTEIPESRERNIWLNSFLPALAASVLAHVGSSGTHDGNSIALASGLVIPGAPPDLNLIVEDIARGGRLSYPDIVQNSVFEIAAAFRASSA